jgi:hypothetical protein
MCAAQAAGARVVPIQYDLSTSELRRRCERKAGNNTSSSNSSSKTANMCLCVVAVAGKHPAVGLVSNSNLHTCL